MKRLLLALLFFLLPFSAFAVPEKKEQREALGEAAGTYLKRRESWIQLKADMKRLQGNKYYLLFFQALLCPSLSFKTYRFW